MAWRPSERVGQGSYKGRVNFNDVYGWEYALANNQSMMNNYWLRWNQYTNSQEASDGNLAQMRQRLSLNSPDRWLSCDHWGCYVFSSADGNYWMPHDNGVNVLFIDGHVKFYTTNLDAMYTVGYPRKLIPELTGTWGNSNP
jgi:prepilin-type processing-associated H-X9-DG protein